jgi:type IV fimbrial biogenesis protein FimT
MNERQQHGLTALELTVGMAIIAILLATAVPALKNYTWNLRMKTAMDVLQTDLKFARSRAITHNIQTVMCPANGADDCSGRSVWQDGWIVFTDINGDRRRQPGEPLLKQAGAVEHLDISSSRSRKSVYFFPNGSAPGSNTSILFCDQRGAARAGKITLSNSGRIRITAEAVKPSANCP